MRFRRGIQLLVVVAGLALWGTGTASADQHGFSPGAPGLGDPYFPLEGNGGYDVLHYDLSFSYDPATDRLEAVNRITARATQNLSRFDLDLQQLTVRRVTVNFLRARFTRDGQELVITPRRHPGGLRILGGGPLRRRAADDRGIADRVRLALRVHPHRRWCVHGR